MNDEKLIGLKKELDETKKLIVFFDSRTNLAWHIESTGTPISITSGHVKKNFLDALNQTKSEILKAIEDL